LQISCKNRKEITAEELAVYIGIAIAYKRNDSPWGQSVVKEKQNGNQESPQEHKVPEEGKETRKDEAVVVVVVGRGPVARPVLSSVGGGGGGNAFVPCCTTRGLALGPQGPTSQRVHRRIVA
jgi:hypothetical protein